jgi:hypothetical protein
MNKKYLCLVLTVILVMMPLSTANVKATNEGSYQQGFWSGSQSGPQHNSTLNEYPSFDNNTCKIRPSFTLNSGVVVPVITNTTACQDGWYN